MVSEKEIVEIKRAYAEGERKILSRMANRLPKGKSFIIDKWEKEKLAELRKLRNGIDNDVVKHLANVNDQKLQDLIEKAYRQGSTKAVADLKKIQSGEIQSKIIGTDQEAIRLLTKEATETLNNTHLRILRQTDDVYRRAVRRGAQFVNTGAGTRIEGAQQVLNEFANRGVTGFVDKAGRSWDLNSYAEMATRTSSARAQLEGNMNRLQRNGHDLVMVSAHSESCPICDPWEGRVLSISGESDQYPSVGAAESDGLFHANCTHNLSAYVPGLTETPEPIEGGPSYENRQQQRYLERGVRKWKRREQAAMTDKAQRKAKSKVNEWQSRMQQFIDETGRYRKYEREAISEAR